MAHGEDHAWVAPVKIVTIAAGSTAEGHGPVAAWAARRTATTDNDPKTDDVFCSECGLLYINSEQARSAVRIAQARS